MKKRMFITTIVMMLVLAVALTTSSLAWFSSSQTSVTASEATFRATSQGTSNVNIKISDTPASWKNSIALRGEASNSSTSMVGMIPINPLVASTVDAQSNAYVFPETTGVVINGQLKEVKHADFKWPAYITFNSAKVGSEGNFIIESTGKNAVVDYGHGTANESVMSNTAGTNVAGGYFYQEFYIHNADSQATISQLKFQLNAVHKTKYQLTESGDQYDYTCDGFAAFIIYDAVPVAAGNKVPDNAIEDAGKTVLVYDPAVAVTNAATQVKADTQGDSTKYPEDYRKDDYYTAWVPFGIFTFVVPAAGKDLTEEKTFQFADLNKTEDTAFVYNNAQILSLDTQEFDAQSGDTGYTLNLANLAKLNDKVVNASGDVVNDGNTVRDDTTPNDYDCGFTMKAGEIFRISMYYWMDGYSMTAFTDTTITTLDLTISVPNS